MSSLHSDRCTFYLLVWMLLLLFRCSVVSHSLWCRGLQPSRRLCPWDSPGKNTGMGCHFLLQGIFPTQGSSPSLLHLLLWKEDSSPLCYLGSPKEPTDPSEVTFMRPRARPLWSSGFWFKSQLLLYNKVSVSAHGSLIHDLQEEEQLELEYLCNYVPKYSF